MLAFALVVAAWIAALIVALLLLAIAGTMALLGKKRMSEAAPPAPERTIESVKNDIAVVKEHRSHDPT